MTCSADLVLPYDFSPTPFCDYLDVTTHPDSMTADEIIDYASSYSTDIWKNKDGDRYGLVLGGASLIIDKRDAYNRISASGKVLTFLRAAKLFDEYLSILGSNAHNVTRLDSAIDYPEDFSYLLPAFKRRYKKRGMRLTQKESKVTFMTSCRASDGRETGTIYGGHRTRNRVTLRGYDKTDELLEHTGLLYEDVSRFELTCRSDTGVTLRDAQTPYSLFWHYAGRDVLKSRKPKDVPKWEPYVDGGWCSVDRVSDPAAKIRYLVENSASLDRMIEEADKLGPEGARYLGRVLNRRLGIT